MLASLAMPKEARKTIWGSLTPEGGERRTSSPMPTPAGPFRTTPWLLHMGAKRAAAEALPDSENTPHCVPGPCRHQTIQTQWALGHGVAGPWPRGGGGLEGGAHVWRTAAI